MKLSFVGYLSNNLVLFVTHETTWAIFLSIAFTYSLFYSFSLSYITVTPTSIN